MSFTSSLKRTLSVLVAGLLLSGAFVSMAFAAPGKENLGNVPKVDASAITVDGKMDAIYEKGLKFSTPDKSGVSSTGYILWSDGYLYVYADVKDAKHDDSKNLTTSPWTTDCIEFFIDNDNDGKDYGDQYRVDYNGYGTWKDRNANKNYYTPDVVGKEFLYGAVSSNVGYTAEMRIPTTATEGKQVGICVQIQGVQGTSCMIPVSGWTTAEYPYIVLGGKIKEEKPAETTAAPKTEDKAPATADLSILYAAVSLAGASGAAVVFSRKKKGN